MARAVLHAAIELETAVQVKQLAARQKTTESAIVQEALDRFLAEIVTQDQKREKARAR